MKTVMEGSTLWFPLSFLLLFVILPVYSQPEIALEPRPEMEGAEYVSMEAVAGDVPGTVAQIPMIGFEDEPEFATTVFNFAIIAFRSTGLREGGRIYTEDLEPVGITLKSNLERGFYSDGAAMEQVSPLGRWSEFSITHSHITLMDRQTFDRDYGDWFKRMIGRHRAISEFSDPVRNVALIVFEIKDLLGQDFPQQHFVFQLEGEKGFVIPAIREGRAGIAYPLDPSSIPPEVLAEAQRAMALSAPAPDNSPPPPPPNAARESSMPRYLLIGGGLLMVLGVFSLIFTRRGG